VPLFFGTPYEPVSHKNKTHVRGSDKSKAVGLLQREGNLINLWSKKDNSPQNGVNLDLAMDLLSPSPRSRRMEDQSRAEGGAMVKGQEKQGPGQSQQRVHDETVAPTLGRPRHFQNAVPRLAGDSGGAQQPQEVRLIPHLNGDRKSVV
jgi:hypothetical protein